MTTTLGIGSTLSTARQQQRRTLSEAAAETRVRESYLAALEEEDFRALGGDVYAKGFLRSYARYLGLDPDPLVDVYRRDHEQTDLPSPSLSPSTQPALPAPGERSPQRRWAIGAAAAVLGILAIGVLNGNDTETPSPPGPPPASPSVTAVAQATGGGTAGGTVGAVGGTAAALASDAPDDPSEPAEPALTELAVEITVAGGPSWMRVTVDGDVAVEELQPQGETLEYTADSDLVLRIGDASNVRVAVNGEDQGVLGDANEVVELDCAIGSRCELTPIPA